MKDMTPLLRSWLAEAHYSRITGMAAGQKRVLSLLTALTYDPQPLVAWRAIEALGLAAAVIAEQDAEFVRNHLRRLVWLVNDESGGIGWRAPEAIGEILRNQPEQFAEFIPILISLLDLPPEDAPRFRPGILWAIGRLAQVAPQSLNAAIKEVLPCLGMPEAQVCGMAAWCLAQFHSLTQPGIREALQSLRGDNREVELFIGGQIIPRRVADLASQALEAIQ